MLNKILSSVIFTGLLIFSLCSGAKTDYPAGVETKIDKIVSIFENGSPVIHYDYIEALGDGRGYTAGKVGFTTGTGDLVVVAERFLKLKTDKPLLKLLPLLKERAKQNSGSIKRLESLTSISPRLAADPDFRRVQDDVADELCKSPAKIISEKTGNRSDLAYLIFYDTLVQHGDGDDPDGFDEILRKTTVHKPKNEKEFLLKFLAEREKVLLNPASQATAKEWRESVDRVVALKRLVDHDVMSLAQPIEIYVWGKHFKLD